MSEHYTGSDASTDRERELEIEVARLNAELDAARGDDPTAGTSRFLAMAAATVDGAMAAARREADEIAEEISAEAETRRDEAETRRDEAETRRDDATRLAHDAEATAARLRTEADTSKDVVERAETAADAIVNAAEEEAGRIVASERELVAGEVAALAEVRSALENERGTLETYHEELRRRVQELAESMVSFMTTEPPFAAAVAIENLRAPELDTGAPAIPALETTEPTIADVVEDEPSGDVDGADDAVIVDAVVEAVEVDSNEVPVDEFAGVPITESVDVVVDVVEETMAPGLFSRASDGDDQPKRVGSLFGPHGARLISQTSPEKFGEAIADDSIDDAAFREFLDGDSEPDPSREWLLRPEQR